MRSGDVASLFSSLTLMPVSDAIARRAGEYLRRFRRSHQGIGLVDYVIAATADLHGAELLTLNVKHFPMYRGLKAPFSGTSESVMRRPRRPGRGCRRGGRAGEFRGR